MASGRLSSDADNNLSKAELHDISRARERAWLRVRFALWRSLGLIVLIYLANVLLNILDVAVRQGPAALLSESIVTRALFLKELSDIGRQAPSMTISFLGILLISMFLAVTARIRYLFHRRQLAEDIKGNIKRFQKVRPDAQIDMEKIPITWVSETLGENASDRISKMRLIDIWLQDDVLVDHLAYAIAAKRFRRDLSTSILASVGAVIIARLLVLFA